MAPRSRKTSALNVRVTPDEMTYLTGLADDLEVSLSEAVRAAIARAYLTDREAGRTTAPSWIRTHDATLLDVDEDED